MVRTAAAERAPGVSAARIAVTVHARDPIDRAGVLARLGGEPGIDLAGGSRREAGRAPGRPAARRVDVLVADALDRESAAALRGLSGRGRGVVLLVRALGAPQRAALTRGGVQVVARTCAVDALRLADAVRGAARRPVRAPVPVPVPSPPPPYPPEAVADPGPPSPAGGLTRREADVIRLVAAGLDTRQVSERLAYSERTVKNVLHAAVVRLRLRNRAHAVAYAVRHGYV